MQKSFQKKKKKVVEIDRLVTSYLILFRIFYFCFLWLAQFSGVFLWSQTFRTELSIKSICVNLLQGQNAGWAVSATDLQLSASCKGQCFPLLCNSLFFSFIIRVPGLVIFLLKCNLYLPGVRWKYLRDMHLLQKICQSVITALDLTWLSEMLPILLLKAVCSVVRKVSFISV